MTSHKRKLENIAFSLATTKEGGRRTNTEESLRVCCINGKKKERNYIFENTKVEEMP